MKRPSPVPSNWTQNEVADLEERAELAEKRLEELEAENERLREQFENSRLVSKAKQDKLQKDAERLRVEQLKMQVANYKLDDRDNELRAENERLREQLHDAHMMANAISHRDTTDAERYRFLRSNKHEVRMWSPDGESNRVRAWLSGDRLDAAIDEAMKDE